MTRAGTLALLALLAAAPVVGQDHGDHAGPDHGALATAHGMPDGWLMRFDRAAATPEMADFQVMGSGWHVKTGRAGAGIYWMPGMMASGEYSVRVTYHLFDPASHAEAFGVFVGGQELGGPGQEYVYFLVRQTGEYLIKRRKGSETENIVGWTAHSAIPVAPAGERGPTQYALAVEVGSDGVDFLVNGATVHTLSNDQLNPDGVVGLRINHILDVHVEELVIQRGL